jgi:3-hydroxyacyl-CoA dehydrogenase/enoyl-CoA hydratase/3-hydroxybutyryl-CoA epimerase/3-hydroxyacyl-CoA dehydrogenase/enoyl-CoA hydratase/3-hydroxybutyryl-CoA epimerase/enoyl-CoA isomerase
MFLPMVVEASRILDEKKVRDPRDVDLGLIFGIGFPPFLGGLLFWADRQGAKSIVERLKAFESLGARYQPTQRLLDMAAKGTAFYD